MLRPLFWRVAMCRVGLEDNLYLEKGVLATNAQLVERAVTIIENMGARVIGPDAVRQRLQLDQEGTTMKAAIIGGGVIGGGWAARFLAQRLGCFGV
jgi:hypothetical protein